MVDALVSGASGESRAGSSPVLGTINPHNSFQIKSCGIFLLTLSAYKNDKITNTPKCVLEIHKTISLLSTKNGQG